MSFNLSASSIFINTNLTDIGRRMLSLGKLSFNKAVFSDREVDYAIDRTGDYLISNNRVLYPANFYPDIDAQNLDGTNAITLGLQQVASAKQFLTADTPSAGFFTGTTDDWTILESLSLGYGTVASASQSWDTTGLTLSSLTYTPQTGDLVFIPWPNPKSGYTFNASLIQSGSPTVALWYRIVSGGSGSVSVDRNIPRFNGATSNYDTRAYFYPYNGIETRYGSGGTQNTNVWNLNIVRTGNLAGTVIGGNISGYTKYGSIEYAGTKHYFGFGAETPSVGFVHYTNQFSGNTYGEQFIEKSIQIYIPTIMWYNTTGNNGEAIRWGANFFDYYGETTYDNLSKTTYRELRDGISSSNKIVGRVYHKLKIIVITDQELLNTISYKSNRNYALPDFNTNLISSPKSPLTQSDAIGICEKGYDYFVTYRISANTHSSSSFGYPESVHCGYVKKITGQNDINNNPQFLQITFPANSFPYMRSDTGLSSYGTGWNANFVQILVNKQLTTDGYDCGNVPSNQWKALSDLNSGGNGVYRATDAGNTTIDPNKLNGYSFVVSNQDYISGSTYQLYSGLTYNQSILNFGHESMFYGIVDLQVFATTYKSIITVYAENTNFNSSVNTSFDSLLDTETYITEIAILDSSDQVVAVAKPTTPIKKSVGRFLAFQLEIDF